MSAPTESSHAALAARVRRARWALVAGLSLSLPSLGLGWFYDDALHHAMLDGALPGHTSGPLELYDFVDGRQTVRRLRADHRLPWFTSDALEVRFFRPIPSALRAAERAVFGQRAWPAHLLSVALFLLWLLVVFDLMETLAPTLAPTATLVFACAGAHGLAVGWVAARYALLVGIASSLGLHAYLRAARGGGRWKPAGWLALGLLCGESALATLAFVGAHVVFDRSSTARKKLRAAAPMLALGAAYVALYTAEGYGAAGGGLYLSPLREPSAFAAAAPERVAVLVAELTTGLPSGVLFLAPPLRPFAWALGVFGCVVATAATRLGTSARDRRDLRWLWAGAVASLIPAAAAIPEGRLVGLATLATSLTVAAILRRARTALGGRERRGRGALVAGAAALLVALGIGPVARVALTLGQSSVARAQGRLEAPRTPSREARYAFVLNADDVLLWLYAPLTSDDRERLVPLSAVPGDVTFSRVDERTLELRSETALGVLDSPLTGLVRARPLAARARVFAGEFTVEVLEPAPTLRVRFTFRHPLSSPRYRWLEWNGAALVDAPIELVGRRRVPYRPGPSSGPQPAGESR